jgi:hypothetical protein
MMKRDTALIVLLALVGAAHMVLGLIANLAPPDLLIKVMSEFYGATVEVTAQSHHIVRIVGAFMIGMGVMAFLACRDPRRNQAIIFGIITVLVLRVIQRIIFAPEIGSAFDIPTARIWLQVAFFLLTAIALFVLRPKPASTPPG